MRAALAFAFALIALPALAQTAQSGGGFSSVGGTCSAQTWAYVGAGSYTITVPSNCTTAVASLWAPGAPGTAGILAHGGPGGGSGDYVQAGTYGTATGAIPVTPGQILYINLQTSGDGVEECISSGAACTGTLYATAWGPTGRNAPTNNGTCNAGITCTATQGSNGANFTATVTAGAGGAGAPGSNGAGKTGGTPVTGETGGTGGGGSNGAGSTAGTAAAVSTGSNGGAGFGGSGAGVGGAGAGGNGTVGGGGAGGAATAGGVGGNGAMLVEFTATNPSSTSVGGGGGGGGGGNGNQAGGTGGGCASGGGGNGGGSSQPSVASGGPGCVYISFPS